jgi:hypothetical protein
VVVKVAPPIVSFLMAAFIISRACFDITVHFRAMVRREGMEKRPLVALFSSSWNPRPSTTANGRLSRAQNRTMAW